MQHGRTPEEYRQKAAEHRRLAAEEGNREVQAQLLLIAEAYDELASLREGDSRQRRIPRKPANIIPMSGRFRAGLLNSQRAIPPAPPRVATVQHLSAAAAQGQARRRD
jgi:hypothetical protein